MRTNGVAFTAAAFGASCIFFVDTVFAQSRLSGSFSVLTYNVAGLPEPLSGSKPSVNTPVISSRLGEYSIIHVQEDFNYHKLLYDSDRHPHRTDTSGPVPVGSGLNTLSNYPWTDLQRITWEACWFNQADCLTPKGFTAMRMQIDTGVSIDFYNLHAEAGDEKLDFVARKKGLEQLSRFINTYSVGNPVILFGDTNTRFYEAQDAIRILTDTNKLTDVWTELIKGGNPPAPGSGKIECPFPVPAGDPDLACELIDKVMYRSSSLIKLKPTAFVNENAKFLTSTGGPLSDHVPLKVPFDYEVSSSLRVSPDTIGGNQNSYFNDISAQKAGFAPAASPFIKNVSLRSGARLDKITYTLSDNTNISHGGNGGGASETLALAAGERINMVEACTGKRDYDGKMGIFYLKFSTSAGRGLEGGRRTTTCRSWTPPSDQWSLSGFTGRCNNEIDLLGVVWGKIN